MRDDERFTPADQLPAGLYARAKAIAAQMADVEGCTVPWLAGRSCDGQEFYADIDLPLEVTDAKIRTRRSVKIHECAELILMNGGETYDKDSDPPGRAHYHANGCEKLDVEEQDGDWTPYCLALRPVIKETDHPALYNLPPKERWDRRPYEDDDPLLLTEIDIVDDIDKSTFSAPGSPTSGLQNYDLEGAVARRRKRRKQQKSPAEPVTKESDMDELKLFIPITKIDAAKRLVYGVATAEKPDQVGEVCDYATTKPNYQKWSQSFASATDGKSLGNLRAMHGNVAAGKLIELAFNDDARQVEICAKVVDDGEWAKVEEGVYTGFSQGGKYVKRWPDPTDNKLIRYTADPAEVSLVDNPCLPDATFSVIKADGSTELRKFKTVAAPAPDAPNDNEVGKQVWINDRLPGKTFAKKSELRQALLDLDAEEAAKKAAGPVLEALEGVKEKLAKAGGDAGDAGKTKTDPAAGDGEAEPVVAKKEFTVDDRKKLASEGKAMKDGSFPIENKDDLANAIKAYGRAKNKAAAKRHIIKRAKALGATDMLPADWPGSTKKDDKTDKVAGDGDLRKGVWLYDLANMLGLLAQLESAEELAEREEWGPFLNLAKETRDRFGALLGEFGDLIAEMLDAVLSSMKDEETTEALAQAALVLDLIKLAGDRVLMKAGAKHSKADKERIKKAHDLLVELDDDCCPAGDGEDDDAEKLRKQLDATNAANAKLLNETILPLITKLSEQVAAVGADVKTVAEQPLPLGHSSVNLRVLDKTQDGAGPDGTLDVRGQLDRIAESAQFAARNRGR